MKNILYIWNALRKLIQCWILEFFNKNTKNKMFWVIIYVGSVFVNDWILITRAVKSYWSWNSMNRIWNSSGFLRIWNSMNKHCSVCSAFQFLNCIGPPVTPTASGCGCSAMRLRSRLPIEKTMRNARLPKAALLPFFWAFHRPCLNIH